jgi:hypothetical protein
MIAMPYAAGNYMPVVETYERYLDAWLLARIRVHFGDREVELDVPVDGRTHAVEANFELPSEASARCASRRRAIRRNSRRWS